MKVGERPAGIDWGIGGEVDDVLCRGRKWES